MSSGEWDPSYYHSWQQDASTGGMSELMSTGPHLVLVLATRYPYQGVHLSSGQSIEIQKGRVRTCSIFQVDSFIGIMQLVVPFSAWDLGQHIPRLLCSAHMLFSHKTTHKDYHSKNHIL